LATICLNEEQFVGPWLAYHYDAVDRMLICEGAARDYPHDAVTQDGLSSDATAELIASFPDPARKISLFRYGWAGPASSTDDRVPAKIELRNVYAGHAGEGYLLTLDVDEFLRADYIVELVGAMEANPWIDALAIPQLHLWQTTSQFITGGYADVPHFRLFRWRSGTRYDVSHNVPSAPGGAVLTRRSAQRPLETRGGRLAAPAIIHYGFCEPKASMRVKNRYYLIRGEATTRPATSEFRHAAFSGGRPRGSRVHAYRGFLPFDPAWLPPRRTLGSRGTRSRVTQRGIAVPNP